MAIASDLSYGATHRREREWHLQHFRNPASVSFGSFMPKFPLLEQELNDLANYMLTLKIG
jgi:ubiquinol-cytochrome c reductase cytochrome b subunit